jgi:[acyl-carrier-protein] S-malonyltransferase
MSYSAQSRLLLLCPGQGNQHAQMFDLARTSPAAGALLDRLPTPALTEDSLFANRHAQPLIVAATLGMWEAIREFTPPPALVAGYSIGELAAYGVAGALTPDDAIDLATRRARLMDDCLAIHPGQALVSISGITLPQAAAVAAQYDFRVSIETGDDTCIAGGPATRADNLEEAVIASGGRSRRLPVEVASHTPYMQNAVAPFAEALRQANFQPMNAPVMAGISATAVHGKDQAVDLLSRQLSEKIRWLASMDACAEAGITYALELGPGNPLSRMMQMRHPHINTRSVADFRTLDGIRKWLERAAE